MIGLKFVYIANILVAGSIAITSLLSPRKAVPTIFENTIVYSEAIRLIGALWAGIFVLSILGLFYPKKMALVLVFQLLYKGIWLLVVALPAIVSKNAYPQSMASFFLIWCLVLPFVIPWKDIFL